MMNNLLLATVQNRVIMQVFFSFCASSAACPQKKREDYKLRMKETEKTFSLL